MPLVTVWIPSYNYGRYLPAAIESVLEQTHRDLELIVFDDGSTDGSPEIAQRYAATDGRVRVLHHAGHENRGVTATIIAAFAASRGVHLCGLAADDTLFPGSVERRVAVLEAHPRATFAYGLIEMLEEDGTPTGELIGTPPERVQEAYATSDLLEALLIHNYVPGHGVLMRRDALVRAGGIDTQVLYSDWELWMRLLAIGEPVFVGAPPVAGHRRHGLSMSLAATADVELSRRLHVFRTIDEKAPAVGGRLEEPRIRAFISLQRAWHEFAAGHLTEARDCVAAAFAADATLAGDASYLLWWLGPHQAAGISDWFPSSLVQTNASAETMIDKGVADEDFGCWAVHEVGRHAPAATVEKLRWGVIANELEARSRWIQPRALRAYAIRALREPRLLREPWFLKGLLCAAGAWHVALRIRDRLVRR